MANYLFTPLSGLLGQDNYQPSPVWQQQIGPGQPQPDYPSDAGYDYSSQPVDLSSDTSFSFPDQPLVLPVDEEEDRRPTPQVGQPMVLPMDAATDFSSTLQPLGDTDFTQQGAPSTADLGGIAARHTAQDEALAKQKTDNFDVTGSDKVAYAKALSDLVNSPKYWGASAEEMQAAARQLASEVFKDPALADEVQPRGGFEGLVDYRKKAGADARPSPVDYSKFGKKTDKTEEDTKHEIGVPIIAENSSTARSFAGFREGLYAAQEATYELLGIDAKGADANRRYYNAVGNLIGPGLQPSDVKTFGDALTFAAQTASEQAPNLAASMAGGGLGGIIKGSLGAAIGAFGSSYALELGQVEENTKDLNPDQKAGLSTVIGAGAAATLDSILPGKVGSALVAKLGKEAAEKAAWQILLQPAGADLKKVVGQYGVQALKNAALEGSTEAAQQIIEEATASYQANGKVEFQPGVLERAFTAGVAGAILGGPTGVLETAGERSAIKQAPLDEMSNMPFVLPVEQAATDRFSPSQQQGGIVGTPQDTLTARPTVLPVDQMGGDTKKVLATSGPVDKQGNSQALYVPHGPITSRFGPRQSFTTDNGQKASSNHAGVDIGLAQGTPVGAAADGVVIFAGKKGGYGNAVVLKFSDGHTVLYGHLSKIDVAVGDEVQQHDTIGNVGHTGNATGPHLHFELRDAQGRPINPMTGQIVKTGSTTSRDAETGKKVTTPTDDTGFPVEAERVDYGEDGKRDHQTENAVFSYLTGQDVVSQQDFHRQQDKREALATAKAILDAPRTVTAEGIATSLDQASENNTAKQALNQEIAQRELPPAQSELPPAQTDQLPIDQPEAAPPAPVADTGGNIDYSQPLPGEEPFYDEQDMNTVVGFMNRADNSVRAIGEPPREQGQLPQDVLDYQAQQQQAPQEAQQAQDQPLVLPVDEGGDAVANEVLANSQLSENGPTPETPESSKARIVNQKYPGFGREQTNLAYEVAPSPEQAVAERWRALPQPQRVAVSEKVNNFVLPKVLKMLGVSANPVGNVGGYLGESNPSITLSTIIHTRASEIAAVLGHVLDQDSVFIISERAPAGRHKAGRGLRQTGVLRISGVTNPEEVYHQLWSGDNRFSGYITNGSDMLLANFTDTPTEELANVADQLTGGQYDISAEKAYVDLIHRDQYDARSETARSGFKGTQLDRLRSETLLYRDQLIDRAEQSGNADGVREPDLKEPEQLKAPPVDQRGQVTLDHFGPEGIKETDPNLYGQNSQVFTNEERTYAANALPQTHFGIATGQPGGYKQEFKGRTHYQGKVRADRLYDASADPANLWDKNAPLDQNEKAIKNAGYAGYWVNHPGMGMVAKMFEPVPVEKVAKPKQQVRTKSQPELREQAWTDAMDVLRGMALQGRHDILTVEVVDAIGTTPDGGVITGEFFRHNNLIRIAAGINENPRETVRHELIHWARLNLFTSTEWSLLAKWAKNDKNLMAWAKSSYSGLTQDELIEEAVAEGFARWDGGRLDQIMSQPTGLVARALAKLRDLIQAVREAIGIAGITRGEVNQAAALLHSFEKGDLTKKRFIEQQLKVFGRKHAETVLSEAQATGKIDQGTYTFLRQNPLVKLQIGWHGTAVADIDQFKLDFIGTGEGAQAYGWGLYFAQSKDVAEWYKERLSGKAYGDPHEAVLIDGTPIARWTYDNVNEWNKHWMALTDVAGRIYDYAREKGKETVSQAEIEEISGSVEAELAYLMQDAAALDQQIRMAALKDNLTHSRVIFEAINGKTVSVKKRGALYQVELPENSRLLNQNGQMADQPDRVQAALEKMREMLSYEDLLDKYEERYGSFEDWTGDRYITTLESAMWEMSTGGSNQFSDEIYNAFDHDNYAMAASIWLREQGVLGSRYYDGNSRRGSKDSYNFVIFDDSAVEMQAKYRIVDVQGITSPLSDPSIPNPSTFRRLHNAIMAALGAIGGRDVDTTDNLVEQWKRKLVNKYQAIINTQKRVAKQLGLKRLPEDINLYDMIAADERGYKLNHLLDNWVKPMAKEMAKRNLSMEDVGLYLYARHAPHRNARIASINKEFNTTTKPGSGMTDAEAAQIITDFTTEGKIADLVEVAKYIDGMIHQAQQERLNSGLLSQNQINAGFKDTDFYVPLRGNEAIEPELEMDFPIASRRGGGFSTPGKEGNRMFGRASRAELEDIVGYVITQSQDAVDRAYRNEIGKTMLAMFQAVPDTDFVQIDRVKRVPVWNKRLGVVEYQNQTRLSPEEEARTVYVKVDGDTHKLTFNNQNPSALRFVKAAKNIGVAALPRVLQVMSGFTRLWSALNTSYNVEFLVRNAAKDAQTALANSQGVDVEVKGLARSILKNLVSLRPLYAALQGTMHNTGALAGSTSPWLATYHEFEANGGKLNYNQVDPLVQALKKTEREIKNAQRSAGNPIKLATGVLQWIDHLNSAFENQTRLAAYKALRDRGIEAKAAAKVARELTTNFQQHGEWGPTINALYGFGNATLIGGARLTKTIVSKPQIALGLILAGFLADMFSEWLDPDRWDQYSEEEKDSYFIFLLPEWAHHIANVDIKVPIGYGINSFLTMGRKVSELMRGKKNEDGTIETIGNAVGDMGASFANAFSPVGGRSFWNWIAPSLVDPIVDIYRNEDNWGRPIMPTQPTRQEQQKPDSQLVFDRTGKFWRTLAQGTNALTGGNEVVPGLVDISPETLKYVSGQLGGGALRTTERIGNAIASVATGKTSEMSPNDIPFARAFLATPYGASDEQQAQLSLFYEHMRDAQTTIGQAKEMIARYGKDSPEYQAFRKDNLPVIEFYKHYDKAEKKLNHLNAADNAAKRGTIRAEGLNRRDRNAIFKATGILVPQRTLKQEEVDKIRAKLKEKKIVLATRFNALYLKDVMGQ